MKQYGFAEIEQALTSAEAAVSVSEAHGCLCGALCVMPKFSAQNWLRELLPDPADVEAPVANSVVDESLLQVYRVTHDTLRGAEMEFTPILPDDDQPLTQRIAAIAQWSQGFLYGFGIGAQAVSASLSDEVTEVLRDLSQIARASETETTGDDAEEQAYTELVEYLRAAVQLIHDDLAQIRSAQAAALSH